MEVFHLFLDKSYFIDSNLKGLKTSKLPVLYYGDADQRFFPLQLSSGRAIPNTTEYSQPVCRCIASECVDEVPIEEVAFTGSQQQQKSSTSIKNYNHPCFCGFRGLNQARERYTLLYEYLPAGTLMVFQQKRQVAAQQQL